MGSHYSHLRLDERRKLANWLEAKMPIAEIADRLGRDASTIYRDIKRGRYTEVYCQTRSSSLITSSKNSHFVFLRFKPTTATNSKPNSIGMSKASGSGTPVSNAARPRSTEKSEVYIDPISRNFTNFSAAKVTSISRSNLTSGNGFTTLSDLTARTTARPLTKTSETS